ncbi:UNVERIFIED_CONTAM: hypothetical protein NCL1_46871 [Trichonephila clavipes]
MFVYSDIFFSHYFVLISIFSVASKCFYNFLFHRSSLSNSAAQQPMRASAYRAHPSIRNHWALRCMSRYSALVVSLKRDTQRLSPQASWVLIYRPTAVGMKG